MLYHRDVFLPKRILGILPQGTKSILYSQHAKKAMSDDRYGTIPEFTYLDFSRGKIIEVEHYERTGIAKIVLRFPLDNQRDSVYALIPTGDKRVWFCKTCWINEANDGHKTLDPTPYAKAV